MSKVEAGEMVLDAEVFDPVALLESCLRLIEKQAEKQGVELISNIAGALPPAFGDERRIKQRTEEHTSELQSLMRTSYAVFCLKKKINKIIYTTYQYHHTIG